MTKQLTQAVFKDAPSWVNSASIDSEGNKRFHSAKVKDLKKSAYNNLYFGKGLNYIYGTGYDTTNWQNSAIDRESEAQA